MLRTIPRLLIASFFVITGCSLCTFLVVNINSPGDTGGALSMGGFFFLCAALFLLAPGAVTLIYAGLTLVKKRHDYGVCCGAIAIISGVFIIHHVMLFPVEDGAYYALHPVAGYPYELYIFPSTWQHIIALSLCLTLLFIALVTHFPRLFPHATLIPFTAAKARVRTGLANVQLILTAAALLYLLGNLCQYVINQPLLSSKSNAGSLMLYTLSPTLLYGVAGARRRWDRLALALLLSASGALCLMTIAIWRYKT